jgi:hypothetical protein
MAGERAGATSSKTIAEATSSETRAEATTSATSSGAVLAAGVAGLIAAPSSPDSLLALLQASNSPASPPANLPGSQLSSLHVCQHTNQAAEAPSQSLDRSASRARLPLPAHGLQTVVDTDKQARRADLGPNQQPSSASTSDLQQAASLLQASNATDSPPSSAVRWLCDGAHPRKGKFVPRDHPAWDPFLLRRVVRRCSSAPAVLQASNSLVEDESETDAASDTAAAADAASDSSGADCPQAVNGMGRCGSPFCSSCVCVGNARLVNEGSARDRICT